MKKNEAQTDLVQQESKVSPVLPNGLKNYLIDIDGTIIRLIFLLMIFSPFPIILTYILYWIVIPKNPNL